MGHARFSSGRYDFSLSDFIKLIKSKGLDLNKIIINPGFYSNSLTQDFKQINKLNAASIVMIDCDLYESTSLVLEFITDLIQEGTILIFDDWFAYRGSPLKGEQRAVSEWIRKNPHIQLSAFAQDGPTQRAFIVHLAV